MTRKCGASYYIDDIMCLNPISFFTYTLLPIIAHKYVADLIWPMNSLDLWHFSETNVVQIRSLLENQPQKILNLNLETLGIFLFAQSQQMSKSRSYQLEEIRIQQLHHRGILCRIESRPVNTDSLPSRFSFAFN